MALESRWEGDRQSWLLGRLRQGGRVTTARMVALRVVDSADGHLSVGEVHERMLASTPAVNISTVYRALERLEKLGFIHRLDAYGEARFGSAEHAHHHAVSTRCGQILELDATLVSRLLSGLEAATAFRPDSLTGLTLRGVCETA